MAGCAEYKAMKKKKKKKSRYRKKKKNKRGKVHRPVCVCVCALVAMAPPHREKEPRRHFHVLFSWQKSLAHTWRNRQIFVKLSFQHRKVSQRVSNFPLEWPALPGACLLYDVMSDDGTEFMCVARWDAVKVLIRQQQPQRKGREEEEENEGRWTWAVRCERVTEFFGGWYR